MGLTNVVLLTLGLILMGNTDSVQGSCPSLWVQIGDMCYRKTDELMTHSEGAEYCSTLSTTYGTGTLATFPLCDDFASFTAYLQLTAPTESNYWVGARTDFLGNWYWETFEPLQLGVPFWAHTEGNSEGQDCAAMDRRFWFQLIDDDCETMKGVACMAPASATREYKNRKQFNILDCPHESTQVGNHCYYFSKHSSTWFNADDACQKNDHHRDGPEDDKWQGELFSPTSCEEFTHVAHHLQTENDHDYWVGAIDVSGYNEWTWVNGESLPMGVPYWAYERPSYSGDGKARYHCAMMSGNRAHYLADDKCDREHQYICKIHFI